MKQLPERNMKQRTVSERDQVILLNPELLLRWMPESFIWNPVLKQKKAANFVQLPNNKGGNTLMKKALVFTVFVLFSFLNAGTLLAADWSDGTGGAIYYNGGNVGIGGSEPQSKLHIYGNNSDAVGSTVTNEHLGGRAIMHLQTAGDNYTYCQVGHYKNRTDGILGLQTAAYLRSANQDLLLLAGNNAKLYFATKDSLRGVIDENGNFGIGTTNPQSKLSVNGTITAKEVVVSTEGWSDYVFKDDYKLMPLNELERNIK
jgi:hypothetical protein